MDNILLNKKFLLVIRIFAIVCAAFLTIVEITNQIKDFLHDETIFVCFDSLYRTIANITVIVLSILLAIKPHKLGFLAVCSFHYAIECTVFEFHNPMGICMLFLGLSVLYFRGFFIHKPKQKSIVITVIYLLLILSELRFGIKDFFNELISKIGYILTLSIPFFLFISIINNQRRIENNSPKTLNLSVYPGLVENDTALLQKVLENKQYKVIAMEVERSEGTVRNRLNKVYDILGVMDRMGFISTYMGYAIVFQKLPD